MERVHKIKILNDFADAVITKDKTFEVRENDRGYQTGDIVLFEAINKNGTLDIAHLINEKEYRITYVLSGWGIKEGYVVFGIKDITND